LLGCDAERGPEQREALPRLSSAALGRPCDESWHHLVQQVLITHYQRLLDYIKPDYVHVMSQGQIVRSGGPELALELETDGYAFLDKS
jgi:hypothetical protein